MKFVKVKKGASDVCHNRMPEYLYDKSFKVLEDMNVYKVIIHKSYTYAFKTEYLVETNGED